MIDDKGMLEDAIDILIEKKTCMEVSIYAKVRLLEISHQLCPQYITLSRRGE